MGEQEKIMDCYRKMYHGMIGKNRAVLDEVLDDSFVLVHITGMQQSKDAFIHAVEDGTLNYFSAKHQRMDASIRDRQAELLGQSVVSAAVFGGGRHTWHLQLKLKLVQKDGAWSITEAKASTY